MKKTSEWECGVGDDGQSEPWDSGDGRQREGEARHSRRRSEDGAGGFPREARKISPGEWI